MVQSRQQIEELIQRYHIEETDDNEIEYMNTRFLEMLEEEYYFEYSFLCIDNFNQCKGANILPDIRERLFNINIRFDEIKILMRETSVDELKDIFISLENLIEEAADEYSDILDELYELEFDGDDSYELQVDKITDDLTNLKDELRLGSLIQELKAYNNE